MGERLARSAADMPTDGSAFTMPSRFTDTQVIASARATLYPDVVVVASYDDGRGLRGMGAGPAPGAFRGRRRRAAPDRARPRPAGGAAPAGEDRSRAGAGAAGAGERDRVHVRRLRHVRRRRPAGHLQHPLPRALRGQLPLHHARRPVRGHHPRGREARPVPAGRRGHRSLRQGPHGLAPRRLRADGTAAAGRALAAGHGAPHGGRRHGGHPHRHHRPQGGADRDRRGARRGAHGDRGQVALPRPYEPRIADPAQRRARPRPGPGRRPRARAGAAGTRAHPGSRRPPPRRRRQRRARPGEDRGRPLRAAAGGHRPARAAAGMRGLGQGRGGEQADRAPRRHRAGPAAFGGGGRNPPAPARAQLPVERGEVHPARRPGGDARHRRPPRPGNACRSGSR